MLSRPSSENASVIQIDQDRLGIFVLKGVANVRWLIDHSIYTPLKNILGQTHL